MALTNCTINSSSVLVTPSQALGSGVANQVLTITPNTGYRVAASLFTNNSGTLTGVTSITLSDSGVAYAEDNTILVTVDLDDSFNPGTTNQTITIDIDGKAILEKDVPKTLSGRYSVTAASANMTPLSGAVSNVAYSGTGSTGTTVDLCSQTVTTSAGYYFATEPSLKISVGDVNNYSVTKTLGYDNDNNLNSVVFDVDGIIPLETDTSDTIFITANDVKTVPAPPNNITAYSINTEDAPYALTKRGLIVYGAVGATYTINITRTGDSHTYDFSTKDFTSASTNSGTLTIASNGQQSTLIDLPVVTADVTYTFTIAAVSPTTLSLNSSQPNPFTIDRKGFKSITVDATSVSRGTFTSKTVAYTNYVGTTINQSNGVNATYNQAGIELDGSETNSEFNFTVSIEDNESFQFKSPNGSATSIILDSNDFTITPNDITRASTNAGTITATRGGNNHHLLTITGTNWYTNQMGTADTVINFDVDDFCDLPSGSGGGGGTILAYKVDIYNSGGFLSGQHYVHLTTGCSGGSTAVTCLNFANIENKWIRLVSIAGGCSSTEMVGQVKGSTTTFSATAYSLDDTYYNSRVDAENEQNGITC
jgi:hypothetical protein